LASAGRIRRSAQAEQEALRLDREQQVKELFSEAFRWREVQILREYLAAIRATAAKVGAQDGDALGAWLRLAGERIESLDPLPHRIRGTMCEALGESTR
jgi:hypothetical protein